MQVDGVGLREQRTIVQYHSQQEALKFLGRVLTDERGIALLHGPRASGKSVVTTRFLQENQHKLTIAVVDGSRLKTTELLTRILEQFGYNIASDSTEELMNMLNVFVVQQASVNQAPVLVIENINDMFPSALAALCKLAEITTNQRFALRMILVSNRDITRVINAPSMATIAKRIVDNYELGPMSAKEARHYLYAKLRSGGVERPDDVFSVEVCERLHSMSGGWPGDLEAIALSIIEQAKDFPVRLDDIVDPNVPVKNDTPKLIVTLTGEQPKEVFLTEKRALIGRSDLSDIVILDQFVSGQHALLIRNDNAVVLVDLKSRNGTFVNSRRVQSKVLLHNDIISLGDHRMKMIYAEGHSSIEIEDPDLSDTSKLKNIADARRAREQKIPTLVPFITRKT